MIKVEAAGPESFEEVYPLLRAISANSGALPKDRWRLLFHYPWELDSRQRGFVLRDGGRAVGFLATILFERMVSGTIVKFSNLSSWITLPEYRNRSLSLFQAALEQRERTMICRSPTETGHAFYMRCGFQVLESKFRLLYPVPSLGNVRQWLPATVTRDPSKILPRLGPEDALLFQHHRKLHCGHLLIDTPQGYSYLIFRKTRGRRVDFATLCSISNGEIFARNLDRVKWELLRACGTPFITVDSRLVQDLAIPFSKEVHLRIPHVFRSETLSAPEIDDLYSELLLLGL